MKIIIPVLCSSYFDLTKFDFSFKDISIYDITSQEFADYIEFQQSDFKDDNMAFVKDIIDKIHFDSDKKYVIVKNNPKDNFNYSDILNVWKFLLIIFPSDLQIEYEINYDFEDNFFQRSFMTGWNRRVTGKYPGEFLISSDKDVEEINEFAKHIFDRLSLDNYIGIAIENYLTSYSASHSHYQYLTLCIALESIIYGNQELTYRLRRTVAVLCGDEEYSSKVIFKNLDKLYKLRSRIIHGEDYKIKKVIEYLKPLKTLVSRTIIELLLHNIHKTEELNNRITEIGFGDRQKISSNWKHYKLNIMTIVESNWTELE